MWRFSLKFLSMHASWSMQKNLNQMPCLWSNILILPIWFVKNWHVAHGLPSDCISLFGNRGCELSILQGSLCDWIKTQADIVIFVSTRGSLLLVLIIRYQAVRCNLVINWSLWNLPCFENTYQILGNIFCDICENLVLSASCVSASPLLLPPLMCRALLQKRKPLLS